MRSATSLAMLVFVVSSMIGMGLGLTIGAIVGPLRSVRLVLLALVANFVATPLLAIGLARLLRLEPPLAIGLLLLGTAAGAPFLPKLAQQAKADLAFALGVMVLLMVTTVVYLPAVLPLLIPGVSVDPFAIARSLVVLMLVPLGIALIARARLPGLAARCKPALDRVSSISLGALTLLLTVSNIRSVIAVFGTGGILAGVLFIGGAFAIGWLLGGAAASTKPVLALGAAQRNIAAALLVGNQSFDDPEVVVMVVVVALTGLFILMPLSRRLADRNASGVTAYQRLNAR
jgi:BASS family bile acid:Na+ symporter